MEDARKGRTISLKQIERNEKDGATGHKYDGGKPPLDLLSRTALVKIAEVMAYGSNKYAAHNWRGGLHWSRVLSAAMRHLMAFNDSEDKDSETGLSHIAHAGCCIMFLLEYETTHPELDDRYKAPLKSYCAKHISEKQPPHKGLLDSKNCVDCTHSNTSTYWDGPCKCGVKTCIDCGDEL